MRKLILSLITGSLLFGSTGGYKAYSQDRLSGQLSLSGAFALYPMAVKWSEEFRKLYPGVKIDISAGGAGKGIADALSGMVDIGMVSREITPEELKRGAFPVAVTKDAVVAVISAQNPSVAEILAKGLRKESGNDIWITGKATTWSQAFGIKSTSPIHIYTRSDACGAAEIWAKLFGKKQEDLNGVGVYGDPGLAQAVKRDPLGIGYNNIGYAYDASVRGIRVLPVDLNNNGKIDPDENFYESMNDIIDAISKGIYPSPPARDLYFVCKGKPTGNRLLTTFIRWVMTDGQKYVNEAGYIGLQKEKISNELKKLD